jgi:hypothetical protein
VAGAVLGNLIADALFGPEESYKVPADYSSFVDYSSSDLDRTDDNADAKVTEILVVAWGKLALLLGWPSIYRGV